LRCFFLARAASTPGRGRSPGPCNLIEAGSGLNELARIQASMLCWDVMSKPVRRPAMTSDLAMPKLAVFDRAASTLTLRGMMSKPRRRALLRQALGTGRSPRIASHAFTP
jgi:hypothetical protein